MIVIDLIELMILLKKFVLFQFLLNQEKGICELISTIVGLTQKYMENKLTIEKTSRGFGTILEIKNKIGVGQTFDIILYDGKIQKKDLVLTIDKDLNFKTVTHKINFKTN